MQGEVKCEVNSCKTAYSEDAKKGFCPDDFPVCTYDADMTRICRVACSEKGTKLVNNVCVSVEEFKKWTCHDISGDGILFCEQKSCPETCVNGCEKDGVTCRENEKKCPETCVNGCEEDGVTCREIVCPSECADWCDDKGKCRPDAYEIHVDENEITLYMGDKIDINAEYRKNNKFAGNSSLNVTTEDEHCAAIEIIESSQHIVVTGISDVECTTNVIISDKNTWADAIEILVHVIDNDANHNYMRDNLEDLSLNEKTCRKYTDCDSENGKGDGFCDSFIGYKCSTKCTSDEQCISDRKIGGIDYHFVCRGDGRCAPDAFVTVWKTMGPSNRVALPVSNNAVCDFDVDWGDGQTEHKSSCASSIAHNYEKEGEYAIKLKGIYDGWKINGSLLTDVKAFGPVGLAEGAFQGTRLTNFSAIDIPDASKLTSLRDAFSSAMQFNSDIGNWDTSNVTDMSRMFSGASSFDQDIGRWDTSKVMDMSSMFSGASSFDQDLRSWSLKNLTKYEDMFTGTGLSEENICKMAEHEQWKKGVG